MLPALGVIKLSWLPSLYKSNLFQDCGSSSVAEHLYHTLIPSRALKINRTLPYFTLLSNIHLHVLIWVETATHWTIKNNEWMNEPSVCLICSRKWQHLGQQQSELREVQIYMKYTCPQKEICMVMEGFFVYLFVWSNLLKIPRDMKGWGARRVPSCTQKVILSPGRI